MLAVNAITNGAIVTALVAVGVLVVGAVHVDVVPVGVGIGVGISTPQVVIADVGVAGDDVVQCREQSLIAQVQGVGIVITRTWRRVLC